MTVAPLAPDVAPLAKLPAWVEERTAEVPGAVLTAARGALGAAAGEDKGDALGLYAAPWVADLLAEALRRELPRVAAAVADDGAEGLARYLEPRDPHGPALAERTRQGDAGLTVAGALVRVAYVLWWERVRDDCLERARRRAWPVALPLGYLEPAQDAYWTPGRVPAPGGALELLGANGRPVARVAADLAPTVAVELDKAGGVTPLRLFRWALREVTRQWWNLAPRPEELLISKGRSGLAKAIGAAHKREVTAALRLGQGLEARGRGWTLGGLWTWHEQRGNRHHGPGWLRLTLAPELSPEGLALRKLRGRLHYLVPFPEREPPLVGSHGEHGAQLALQHVFMAELRTRTAELDRYGAIRLDLGGWRRLALRVGLRTPLERVLGAWCNGEGQAPPWLAEPGPGLWTLAPDLEHLIAFMLEGEARTVTQRVRVLEGRRKRDARRG